MLLVVGVFFGIQVDRRHLGPPDPVLQSHFTRRTIDDDSALLGIRNEVLAFDLDGMRGDRDLAVAVRLLQRNAHNSRELRRTQLALIDQILALIEQAQRD